MTALITAELMDATWQHVAGASAARIAVMQNQCNKHQPALLEFVVGATASLPEEAAGLAMYAYLVIFQAFMRSGAALRKVRETDILSQWEASGRSIAGLRTRGERTASAMLALECAEPNVLDYIAGALEYDEEDPIDLTDEEYWHIVHVLLTATECLHQARKRR
ncbi:MAG TPA: hypothetical protein PJ986_02265 [Gammaproteobacteria bacterium]|nr:hypothetical protein [Gammaproteobacteria bacterium]